MTQRQQWSTDEIRLELQEKCGLDILGVVTAKFSKATAWEYVHDPAKAFNAGKAPNPMTLNDCFFDVVDEKQGFEYKNQTVGQTVAIISRCLNGLGALDRVA